MPPDKICKLVLGLPPDEPYFRLAFRNRPGRWPRSLPERLRVACGDPELPGNFARWYAAAELPLPPFEWGDAVYRLYEYCLHPERGDENLHLAVRLQLPDYWFERDVTRAQLWCPDATDAEIAETFQFEPEVVHLMETLFWNCRDRSGELLYFAQILNGRRPELRAGPGEFGRDLLIVARKTGRRAAVLDAADLARGDEREADDKIAEQLEESLQALAATGQEQALALCEKYLQQPVVNEYMDDLTKLGLNPKAAVLMELLMKDAMERLQAEQEELKRQLAVAGNSGDKTNSGSTPQPPHLPVP
jgi:hypothetical protein